MAGTITASTPITLGYGVDGKANAVELPVSFTADADAATIPALSIATYSGWILSDVIFNPGSTAPTDSLDIALTDNDHGYDIAEGQLLNLSSTTSETFRLANPPVIRSNGFTLTITGNSVNSATGAVNLVLIRP